MYRDFSFPSSWHTATYRFLFLLSTHLSSLGFYPFPHLSCLFSPIQRFICHSYLDASFTFPPSVFVSVCFHPICLLFLPAQHKSHQCLHHLAWGCRLHCTGSAHKIKLILLRHQGSTSLSLINATPTVAFMFGPAAKLVATTDAGFVSSLFHGSFIILNSCQTAIYIAIPWSNKNMLVCCFFLFWRGSCRGPFADAMLVRGDGEPCLIVLRQQGPQCIILIYLGWNRWTGSQRSHSAVCSVEAAYFFVPSADFLPALYVHVCVRACVPLQHKWIICCN